ncbi:MAG: hypothetical protein SNJ78_04700 [Spirochaetales bacterium]
MKNPELVDQGTQVLDWLLELQFQDNKFSPVENRGWYSQEGEKPKFDQQPIEAQSMVEACLVLPT